MIKTLRQTLAADLAPLGHAVTVALAWPDRVTPPCVLVTPPTGGSYVTSGPAFTEYTISLDVVALVAHGSPTVALAALESLIEGVLTNTADWELSGVDSPSLISVSGSEFLHTTAHLSKQSRL